MKHSLTIRLREGTLTQVQGGVRFEGHDGRSLIFQGVRLTTRWVPAFMAFQLLGTIHLSAKWIKHGITLQLFAHEYGHYLQQREMGFWRFLRQVAIPSAWSVVRHPNMHAQQSFERDATLRGQIYMKQHWEHSADHAPH